MVGVNLDIVFQTAIHQKTCYSDPKLNWKTPDFKTIQGTTIDAKRVRLEKASNKKQATLVTLHNVVPNDAGNYSCTFWFDEKSKVQGHVLLDVFSEF